MKKPTGAKLSVMSFKKSAVLLVHRDLIEKIQYLVGKAPKEAQWYHTVERLEQGSVIMYRLTELHVPPQFCSGTEVETTPEQQIEYFNYLSEKYGGMDAASDILKRSGAWCHSHVDMSVSPSTTDHDQFCLNVKQAHGDGNDTPQIMLIFNKKDEYYSRAWDPVYGVIFQDLDIVTEDPLDFSDLEAEISDKFRSPPAKVQVTPTPPHHTTYEGGKAVSKAWGSFGTKKSERSWHKQANEMKSDDKRRLHNLIVLCNAQKQTTSSDIVKNIMTIIDSYIKGEEYPILEALLFGDPKQLSAIPGMTDIKYSSSSGKPARGRVEEQLCKDWIEEDQVSDAIEYTLDLRTVKNQVQAYEIVDDWKCNLAAIAQKSVSRTVLSTHYME